MKTEIVVIAAVAIAIYNNNATVKQGQCECNKYIGLIYRAETYADAFAPGAAPGESLAAYAIITILTSEKNMHRIKH